jgi:hypothetical protein
MTLFPISDKQFYDGIDKLIAMTFYADSVVDIERIMPYYLLLMKQAVNKKKPYAAIYDIYWNRYNEIIKYENRIKKEET